MNLQDLHKVHNADNNGVGAYTGAPKSVNSASVGKERHSDTIRDKYRQPKRTAVAVESKWDNFKI
jgi:hypothetical protein